MNTHIRRCSFRHFREFVMKQSITEQLKANNPINQIGTMNCIRHQAELIYN